MFCSLSYISWIRRIAAFVFSWLPKAVSRKYPSPLGPNPDPGVLIKSVTSGLKYRHNIILMHDIYGTTADAAQVLIPALTAQGYQLVTVSELAACRGGAAPGHKYSQFR